MNQQTIITTGSRAVVINDQDGHVTANLYVNARDGIQNATICHQRWTGRTVAGAKRWAAKVMA